MDTEQASASGSLQSQSDGDTCQANTPQNTETGSSTSASETWTGSGQALEEFLRQSPWFVFPNEVTTHNRVDEETGKTYMYLNNAPINNYLALSINDGMELAAGGDREFLGIFLQTQLEPSERYHIIVIPERNVQKAGVPRWEDVVGELDQNWFGGGRTGAEKPHNPGTMKAASETGDDDEKGEAAVEPSLTSFLPRMIFAASPTPSQSGGASPLPQESTIQTAIERDDFRQHDSQQFMGYAQEEEALGRFVCFPAEQERDGSASSGESDCEDQATDSTSSTTDDNLHSATTADGSYASSQFNDEGQVMDSTSSPENYDWHYIMLPRNVECYHREGLENGSSQSPLAQLSTEDQSGTPELIRCPMPCGRRDWGIDYCMFCEFGPDNPGLQVSVPPDQWLYW